MKQILSSLLLTLTLLGVNAPAHAQLCGPSNPNCIVPTAPYGTNNSQAASTAFVQQALQGAGLGNVGGPGSSTVGYVATWANTLGTLLASTAPLQIFGAVTANDVLAGPATGGNAFPTFRPLTSSDIPGGINICSSAAGGVQYNNGGVFGCDSGFTYAGSGVATIALGTITTSKIGLTITGTYNNSGVTFPGALVVNVTNTASAQNSAIADFKLAGSDVFSIIPVNAGGSIFAGVNSTSAIAYGQSSAGCAMLFLNSGTGTEYFCNGTPVGLQNTTNGWNFVGTLGISGGVSTPNGLLLSPTTGVFNFGGADIGNPIAQTLRANGVAGGTSNTSGAVFTLVGGASTGSATGGPLWLSTTPAGSSGTSQNAAKQVLGVDGNTHARIGNTTAPTLTSCGTNPIVTGSDLAGIVEMGSGSPTGCTITFNVAYAAAPFCTVTWEATPLASQSYTVSNTAITLTQTGTSNDLVNYHCMAQNGG